jgi:ketosteroid isomerase-like protein
VEQSPDLKDVMLRYYEAVSQGDAAFMDRILSSQCEVLIVGTDPNEWWTDPTTINQTLKSQAQAGIKVVSGDLLCYREGSVGWVADRARFVLADGSEVPLRFTAVFRQEDHEWRLVQAHASIGVPNVEVVGTDLKT